MTSRLSDRAARLVIGALALAVVARAAQAETPKAEPMSPAVREDSAVKLSDHVYMIEGFPNIAIVVGDKATLVVDTGLGPKPGAAVAHTAAHLSRGPTLYLTSTHFHPEHAGGEAGFPASTIVIRPRVQQEELDKHFKEIIDNIFSKSFPTWVEGITFRKPGILFDKQHDLDLGGVHAQLLWLGPAHTYGDELVLVREDSVLITGDVVQNKQEPYFAPTGGSPRAWIKTVDAVAKLHPKLIVPDHSAPAGETLIAEQREFLVTLDARAHALKAAGVPVADAAKTINAEFATRYSDWHQRDLTPGVEKAYAD